MIIVISIQFYRLFENKIYSLLGLFGIPMIPIVFTLIPYYILYIKKENLLNNNENKNT